VALAGLALGGCFGGGGGYEGCPTVYSCHNSM